MANEYLQRTPTSTGNAKVFTISCWVKRNSLGAGTNFYTTQGGGEYISLMNHNENNTIQLSRNAAGTVTDVSTTNVFRDVGSWMHLMLVWDTTKEVAFERVKLYVNGVLQDKTTGTYPTINYENEFNKINYSHTIGTVIAGGSPVESAKAEFTDVFMVDGQALTPDVFGFYKEGKGYISAGSTQATDFRPGQWVPKTPRVIKAQIERNGGFGVNGFYLPMNDSSNFGADFHCEPNSIITLKGEDLPQPKNGAPTTTDAYVSQLRTDPYAANLVLALPFVSEGSSSGLGDYSADIKGSGSAISLTNAGVSIASTAGYYGSAAFFNNASATGTIKLTGTSDIVNFGSGDWTVEGWIFPTQLYNYLDVIGTRPDNGPYADAWHIGIDGNGSIVVYSNAHDLQTPAIIKANQWTHFAAVRNGNNLSMYVNGVAAGINTNYTKTPTRTSFGIGGFPSQAQEAFSGYMQDLRIYKGVAKYKGGFDVPKPYTPVGIATWRAVPDCTANNFATLNSIEDTGGTITNGNLTFDSDGILARRTTFATPGNGKWYAEFRTGNVQSGTWEVLGIHPINQTGGPDRAYAANGQFWDGSAWGDFGTAWSNGDIIGIAYNQDDNQISFYLNGTLQGSTQSYSSSESHYFLVRGFTNSIFDCNFGQNPTFGGRVTAGTYTDSNGKGLFKYQPPSGFLALCEDNLPTPAISDPGEYFKTVLYTGDGNSGRSITGIGFTPDLVWIKRRNGASDHVLQDSVRGFGSATKLSSSSTNAESVVDNGATDPKWGYLNSADSDGFSLNASTSGDQVNKSTADPYVAWCWKAGGAAVSNTDGTITSQVSANQDAGFSIVSYTGTGANATVGHGLGKAPKFILIKRRSGASNWAVGGSILGSASTLYLNLTNATETYTDALIGNIQTSTTFQLGTDTNRNELNGTHIAYCWAEIEGFSKFGSYVGNASADGPFVYCGFKPAWVMAKRTNTTGNWVIQDSSRNSTNPTNSILLPNDTSIDQSNIAWNVDFVSNGFKIRTADGLWNDGTYIFAAFAESPINYSNSK